MERPLVRPVNGHLTPGIQADVQSVLDENLENVHEVRACIMNREITLF